MAASFQPRQRWAFLSDLTDFEHALTIIEVDAASDEAPIVVEFSEAGQDRFHEYPPAFRIKTAALGKVATELHEEHADGPGWMSEVFEEGIAYYFDDLRYYLDAAEEDAEPEIPLCPGDLNRSLRDVLDKLLTFEKCIELGEFERIQRQLHRDPEIASRPFNDHSGERPLHAAARAGRAHIVHFLIDWGADVNVRDDSGSTPLHAAAEYGQWDAADLLLACGANPDAVDASNRRPIDLAVQADSDDSLRVAALLEEHGTAIDIDVLAGLGRCDALRERLSDPDALSAARFPEEIVPAFLRSIGRRFAEDESGTRPFEELERVDFRATLRLLLEGGAELTAWGLMSGAVRWPDESFVRLLLEHGANPNGDYFMVDVAESDSVKALLREFGGLSADDPDQAVLQLSQSLRWSPNDSEDFAKRAEAWKTLGQYDRALADYDRAIACKRDETEALAGKAMLLACCPDPAFRDGAEALRLARRAYRVNGGGHSIMVDTDTYEVFVGSEYVEAVSAAHAELGRFEKAADELRQASCKVYGDRKARYLKWVEHYAAEKPRRDDVVPESLRQRGLELAEQVDRDDAAYIEEYGEPEIEQDEGDGAYQIAIDDRRFSESYEKRFVPDTVRELVEHPEFGSLRALAISDCPLRTAGVDRLIAALPGLRLRELELEDLNIPDEQGRRLVEALNWDELTTVDLSENHLGAATMIALASRTGPLKSLDLHDNRLRDDALAAMAAAAWPATLETLNLSDNRFTAEGLRALSRAEFPRLRELRMYGNLMHDAEFAVIAAAEAFPVLQQVDLSGNRFRLLGLRALGAAPWLKQLETLTMTNGTGGLDEDELAALFAGPCYEQLTELNLSENRIRDPQFDRVFTAERFPSLKTWNLRSNRIGPEGAAALARCELLSQLESLDLDRNRLGDDGARRLAESPYLDGLKELSLAHNAFSIDAAEALAESPYLDALETLSVTDDEVGEEGMKVLRRRFGDKLN